MSTSRTEVEDVEDGGRPIIRSKLEAPVPRRRISRGALLEACAGQPRKLTLIRAPAGWGKSTLLADWHELEGEERPFAWVALDGDDSDVVRFWTYVIHALRTLDPGVGRVSLPLLRTPRTDVVGDVLPELFNELSRLPRPGVLVLDDYHLVRNPEVDEGLSALLEHLPRTVSLVIASRSEPALPLARLRARGELAEVDAQALGFSEEEAERFLNSLHGLGLDRDDVVRLRNLTEGWAAGLYLATLAIRDRESAHEFVEAFAGDDRHVVDYLSSEVLAGLPAEVRAFLLETSVLDRLCAPLCDAVVDGRGSAGMLQELERSNSFIVPLDTRREWYAYHHLFRDLLRLELTREDPERARVLHRRASAWLRDHGEPSEAIHQATAAGDVADAAELILRHWVEYRNAARLETLLAWLDGLPGPAVAADPRLCLVKASTLQEVGRIADAEHWLEVAESTAVDPSLPAGPETDAAGLAAVRAINHYFVGNVGGIAESAGSALELDDPGSGYWRSALLTTYGVSRFLGGEPPAAARVLDEAVAVSQRSGHALALVHALGWCAVVHAELDDRARVEAVQAECEALLRREPGLTNYFGMAMTHVARGLVLQGGGRLDEAELAVSRALALAHKANARLDLAYGLLVQARVKGARGERDSAAETLERARVVAEACVDPGVLPELLQSRPSSPRRTMYVEELSERERAVLRLMRSDLSQREIGEQLFVSVNTVKTHVRSIYRKLAVDTRVDAVARARELGLL